MRFVISGMVSLVLSLAAAAANPAEPLTPDDVTRYQAIFEAQEDGDWATADNLIAKLDDKVLLGYVLEQRYMHPTAYRSSYPELRRWLAAYADHPNAGDVYRLAKRRQAGAAMPRRPSGRRWRSETSTPLHPRLAADYEDQSRAATVRRIEARLRELTHKGHATQALNYLNDPRQFNELTAAQTDRARGWIAAAYYHEGDLTRAKNVADLALERSSDHAVLSHWIRGLVAWREEDYGTAYAHFSAQADITYQEDSLRAGAAYWAARGALRNGKPVQVTKYLSIAAQYPFTLYGQLALSQLGLDPDIDWNLPTLTEAEYQRLVEHTPRIARAAALAQIGMTAEAEQEVKWAHAELPGTDDRALLSFAHTAGLPSSELTIATLGGGDKKANAYLQAGLFPIPDYAPNNGFEIDQALLYALMRQESQFMTEATSRVGAKGLMQLMPRTASYISGDRTLQLTRSASKLYDPGYNMQLGQSYVQRLLTEYNDGSGDLFEMALSYNWGPGNFRRWKAENDISDPLLMIESVPNTQARHFVDVVMTNLWVYRDRLGEPAPSRDALARGDLPVYQPVTTR